MTDRPPPTVLPGRSCASCTMCCKLLKVKELDKPSMQWCPYCTVGQGCSIYEKRPAECAQFYCDWLTKTHLDEHWRPSKSRMVVTGEGKGNVSIYVDPDRRGAWQREPYYSFLKHWSLQIYPARGQLIVWEGNDAIAVMPNMDKRLGPVSQDQVIAVFQKATPKGIIYDAHVMAKDAEMKYPGGMK